MSNHITVRIRGGVVQSVENVPAGHTVVVYDYDVSEAETADADDAGERCCEAEWGGRRPIPELWRARE
jgi:hypothetical protein